jgi:hypothetical protein
MWAGAPARHRRRCPRIAGAGYAGVANGLIVQDRDPALLAARRLRWWARQLEVSQCPRISRCLRRSSVDGVEHPADGRLVGHDSADSEDVQYSPTGVGGVLALATNDRAPASTADAPISRSRASRDAAPRIPRIGDLWQRLYKRQRHLGQPARADHLIAADRHVIQDSNDRRR